MLFPDTHFCNLQPFKKVALRPTQNTCHTECPSYVLLCHAKGVRVSCEVWASFCPDHQCIPPLTLKSPQNHALSAHWSYFGWKLKFHLRIIYIFWSWGLPENCNYIPVLAPQVFQTCRKDGQEGHQCNSWTNQVPWKSWMFPRSLGRTFRHLEMRAVSCTHQIGLAPYFSPPVWAVKLCSTSLEAEEWAVHP